jgi:hypothetical protein
MKTCLQITYASGEIKLEPLGPGDLLPANLDQWLDDPAVDTVEIMRVSDAEWACRTTPRDLPPPPAPAWGDPGGVSRRLALLKLGRADLLAAHDLLTGDCLSSVPLDLRSDRDLLRREPISTPAGPVSLAAIVQKLWELACHQPQPTEGRPECPECDGKGGTPRKPGCGTGPNHQGLYSCLTCGGIGCIPWRTAWRAWAEARYRWQRVGPFAVGFDSAARAESANAVTDLKRAWLEDPTWDIEKTRGLLDVDREEILGWLLAWRSVTPDLSEWTVGPPPAPTAAPLPLRAGDRVLCAPGAPVDTFTVQVKPCASEPASRILSITFAERTIDKVLRYNEMFAARASQEIGILVGQFLGPVSRASWDKGGCRRYNTHEMEMTESDWLEPLGESRSARAKGQNARMSAREVQQRVIAWMLHNASWFGVGTARRGVCEFWQEVSSRYGADSRAGAPAIVREAWNEPMMAEWRSERYARSSTSTATAGAGPCCQTTQRTAPGRTEIETHVMCLS